MAKTDPFAPAAAPGDPTMTLVAQVNRWHEWKGLPLFPLESGLVPRGVADEALTILMQRYAAETALSMNFDLVNEMAVINKALTSDSVSYVQAHREALALALSRYGDSLGLPKAVYGYGASKIPTWIVVTAAGGGLLALGSLLNMLAKRRKRLAA